jgi:hypothetical protein
MLLCTSAEVVLEEKLTFILLKLESGRLERYFCMTVVFAVPLSPTKRIGRRGARDRSIALREEEKEKRGREGEDEGGRAREKRGRGREREGGKEGERWKGRRREEKVS